MSDDPLRRLLCNTGQKKSISISHGKHSERYMRIVFCLLLVMMMTHPASHAQIGSGHKSEAQIARMTPDQRVEEYCEEHSRHTFLFHDKYEIQIREYLVKDSLKVMPQVTRNIEAYDPARREGADQQKFRRYEAAVFILSYFEIHLFRVRAFEEGRKAIEALKRMSEKLRILLSKTKGDDEYEMGRRYRLNLLYVKSFEGNCSEDTDIQRTLRIRYKINLSDEELSAFVAYLIERDPYYPSWSQRGFLEAPSSDGKEKKKHFLLVKPEQYYQAYLEYQVKKSTPK